MAFVVPILACVHSIGGEQVACALCRGQGKLAGQLTVGACALVRHAWDSQQASRVHAGAVQYGPTGHSVARCWLVNSNRHASESCGA